MNNQTPTERLTLSAPDAAAVDALLGGDTDAPCEAARLARLREWLNVLHAANGDATPDAVPAAPADLAQRTLARIADERMKITSAQPAPAAEKKIDTLARRRWPRRLAEIAAMAVAASIFVIVAIVGVEQAHRSNMRTLCDQNMRQFSAAFAAYATANGNALPSLEQPANANWLVNIGPGPRTNAANLSPLISGGFLAVASLYCPGNLPAQKPSFTPDNVGDIGYSYTHVYGPTRPVWDGRVRTIILADRSPLFLPTAAATPNPDANSPNHSGRGNYVLLGDGSVTWTTSPNVGPANDNIWTVVRVAGGKERVTTYLGTEMPAAAGDVFLCP